ncbi:pyrimidine-nucleoside phosphorylase [Lachnoclostridium pacaense]|uniref:pyrimidine-nucleoside phosphorylase n=1 Tax=Enterocloster hominis (ex Hitch et al. 2024) TaxID=1917870 RepID=UPI001D12842F|nr:pyrimidine-nucleoside phosphorylase [Lachnoclostridium pacaense]MCC2816612.1 pyrimidine-nucleoside phosphorylase [Lachnoclostridium pacaense]
MRMYDLIETKKRGGALTKDEIAYMVRGFVSGGIPDYQMSAMLMAIYFQGMNDQEITYLTLEMAHSGDMVDLSPIEGIKVDKHSTGGVGDKTTLVAGPMVASLGVKVAKMSGRGLGHTGGTVDKLESIPGFKTAIPREEFFDIVNRNGIAVIGQSGNMVPADKKLYALRDVTATVDSIPLIASSIMSKKLAAGSDSIVLDVKTGSGAFMKTLEESISLAQKMVSIGCLAGRRCCALITNMDIPLGYAIGNSLEMTEAIRTLKGEGPEDLTRVCLELAANMLHMAGKGTVEECRGMAEESIHDGSALKCLASMVKAQGGDESFIWKPEQFESPSCAYEVKAPEEGYISHMDTEGIGIASVLLGAGRNTKEDAIDYGAGIILKKKYGEKVMPGDVLAVLYADSQERIQAGADKFLSSCTISQDAPGPETLIYARVSEYGVERFG